MPARPSLRQRNRLNAMRLVQQTAVEMFEASGFDATSIEAIADTCGVSASTIYRHFGTKEHIVLWDERDEVIDAELGDRLSKQPPIAAFRDAVVIGLAERNDIDLFLRRLRLIYAEPEVGGAALRQDREERLELAAAIALFAGRTAPTLADDATSAVCLAALDIALEHWQRDPAAVSLTELIDQSIRAVIDTR